MKYIIYENEEQAKERSSNFFNNKKERSNSTFKFDGYSDKVIRESGEKLLNNTQKNNVTKYLFGWIVHPDSGHCALIITDKFMSRYTPEKLEEIIKTYLTETEINNIVDVLDDGWFPKDQDL